MVEELIGLSPETITDLITELGQIGQWIQAIGLVIIFWFIFEIIFLINNIKRRKQLYLIKERLDKIEKKLDKLLKK